MDPIPIISGAFSAFSQHQANQANRRMARDQMAFQERMSSTSHQREVEDLRKAGLNPLLSVNAGASSPGGASAHMEAAGAEGVSSARDTRRLQMELAGQRKQFEVSDSQIALNRAGAASHLAGIPQKEFIGGVAGDARSLYRAMQEKIREMVQPGPSTVPYRDPWARRSSAAQVRRSSSMMPRMVPQVPRGETRAVSDSGDFYPTRRKP